MLNTKQNLLNGVLRKVFESVLLGSLYGSLAMLVLLFVFTGSASAYYEVIDLGILPGGTSWSCAWSINDSNQIVGCAESSGQSHSCLFDSTGGGANIDLGSLGYDESIVCAFTNNNGQIVGSGHLSPGFTGRDCLFDPTGGGANMNLGVLPGYMQSIATAINNHDYVVGWSENYGCGPSYYYYYSHATRFYTTGGSPVDLGSLSGYNYSAAYSLNDNDQIVGASWHYNPNGYDARATLFDATGGGANIDLGSLVGYNYSYAQSNNNGQIAGYSYNFSGPNRARACLFDPTGGGSNIDLGTVGGYDNSYASSINDHGQIVGNVGDWYSGHACLFDPTGGGNNIDLNNLINPLSGWTLNNAFDINNNGWIVGVGINSTGKHAFLLKTDVVPEPSTLLLLGSGLVGLVGYSRKKLFKKA